MGAGEGQKRSSSKWLMCECMHVYVGGIHGAGNVYTCTCTVFPYGRMGILLFPSIMGNVNSLLPLLSEHVLAGFKQTDCTNF